MTPDSIAKAIATAKHHVAVADERERAQAVRDQVFVPAAVVRGLLGVLEQLVASQDKIRALLQAFVDKATYTDIEGDKACIACDMWADGLYPVNGIPMPYINHKPGCILVQAKQLLEQGGAP